jgi:hypothetical protein
VIDGGYFDRLFDLLEGTGVTFLYRANLCGRSYYRSRLMSPFDQATVDHDNPDAQIWRKTAAMMEGCDPLAEAVRAARQHGVPIYVWWNWNEWHNVRAGFLDLNDRTWYDKPRKYWCTRDGSRFYCGAPDWGAPEVVERLLGLAAETLDYGIDGFFLSMRSHSWWACWPSPGWDDHLEPFGFNDSVVQAYQEKHGVDIRYEDYDEEQWNRVKGEIFTAFLARTGALVHRYGKPFIMGTEPDRYAMMVDFESRDKARAGGQYLHLYNDWEAWATSGSIDGICSEESCPRELSTEGSSIEMFKKTLPAGFPTYTWADAARWIKRIARPFSLVNWDPIPIDGLLQQIAWAKDQDAAGIFLHSLYHYTSCDSGGESIGGYGVLPRTDYLDALRGLQRSSG